MSQAAALCAFARARRSPLHCFAYVTAGMAPKETDFGEGVAEGIATTFEVVAPTCTVGRMATTADPRTSLRRRA